MKKIVSFTLEEGLVLRLKEEAYENRVSVSQWVEMVLMGRERVKEDIDDIKPLDVQNNIGLSKSIPANKSLITEPENDVKPEKRKSIFDLVDIIRKEGNSGT